MHNFAFLKDIAYAFVLSLCVVFLYENHVNNLLIFEEQRGGQMNRDFSYL